MKHKSLTALIAMLGVALAISVWGDSTTLGISGASVTVTSLAPTTLNFPISRGGDTSYDSFVQFQTVDGTAVGGIDYTAASGSVVIPAGQSSATIPVSVAGSVSNNPSSKAFQMLLLGGGGAGMGFTPSFAAAQTFATGRKPVSVITADLNGDGVPDLIAANQNDDTVSVMLNTTAPGAGTPSFAAQQTFATGSDPFAVTTADLTGDGKRDLIVANFLDNTVSVLLNTTAPGATTPSFATQQVFAVGDSPIYVTAADVNGDGKPDLIVANLNDNTVSVLLNTTAPGATTASFATQQIFATGNEPRSVTAADLNGDGRPDLIVANEDDDTVSVLLNTTAPGATTPSFATQQTFATGDEPISVKAGDVNGDGRPDLIVANSDDDTVSVLLNTTAPGATTPSFAAQQTFDTGDEPFQVTVADVNGDGKPDLLVANFGDGTVSVLLNITAPGADAPSFAPEQAFSAGFNPASVTVADVNGDGKPDLILANQTENTLSVLLNTMPAPTTTFDSNSFSAHQSFATGNQPHSVTAADVNGDGKPDLIVANQTANTVSVLLNTTAPGATMPSFATQQTFATGSFPISVTTADINGDGLPDLIVANNTNPGTVSVLLNTTAPGATTPSFATQQTFATGVDPISVTVADINGDGLPDLIVANQNFYDSTVSVLLNTTAPGATTPSFAAQQTFATGNIPSSVTAADVNGDGLPDLIVANSSDNTVSVLLNTTAPGATTPSFATQQTFAVGNSPQSVTTADVNGDGMPDLIVANGSDNTVSVLLNTTTPGATTASFATQQTFATGSDPSSVTAADVNGDGKPDLIVANSSSGSGTTVSVLLNTTAPGASTPSFATQQTFGGGSLGSDPFSVTAADVNGDGTPDLIVADFNGSTVSVLLNALYAATPSGSPATGTIHYNIPVTTVSVPASLAFGNVPDGDTASKNITVKNTGANLLYVGNVTSNDPEFVETDTTCPSNGLAHSATCTITFGFTPAGLGAHSATIEIFDNVSSSPQHVAATGSGTIDMTVTPATFAFGSVKIGSKTTKSITVSNKQTSAVSLSEGFSGANPTDFTIAGDSTCGFILAAKTNCVLIVTYAPSALGPESATMTVTDSPDAASPSGYPVSFTSLPTIPATVLPATLAFGTLTSHTPTKTKDVTVTNLSRFPLSVSEGSATGPYASDFAVTGGTCGSSVAADSTCTVAVKFTPTGGGAAESASIAVTIGSDPTSPHNISLTGTGPP